VSRGICSTERQDVPAAAQEQARREAEEQAKKEAGYAPKGMEAAREEAAAGAGAGAGDGGTGGCTSTEHIRYLPTRH
jgi:hypothetical protein